LRFRSAGADDEPDDVDGFDGADDSGATEGTGGGDLLEWLPTTDDATTDPDDVEPCRMTTVGADAFGDGIGQNRRWPDGSGRRDSSSGGAALLPRSAARRRSESTAWNLLRPVPILPIGLCLIVASEFVFRVRAQDQTLGGSVDLQVALEVLVYGVAGIVLLTRVRPSRRGLHPALWALVAYLAITAMSALSSPYPKVAQVRVAQLAITTLIALVLSQQAKPRDFQRFFAGYVVLIACAAPIGLVYSKVAPIVAGRYTWLAIHPVNAANMLGAALVIAVAAATDPRVLGGRLRRGPAVLLAIEIGGFLVATQTRSAVGAALVAALVCVWFIRPRGARAGVAVTAFLVVALAAATAWSAIFDWVERGEGVEQLENLNSRTNVWDAALELVKESPITGRGYAAARGVFLDRFGLGGAHNAFIEVAVNSGLVGLTALIGQLALVARGLWRSRSSEFRRTERCLVAGIFGYFVILALTAGQLGQAANVHVVFLAVVIGWIGANARGGDPAGSAAATSRAGPETPVNPEVPSSVGAS
jgi:O-antigen ligase